MGEIYKLDEIIFRRGRNAKENHRLIEDADSNDWWFHMSETSSCHVIMDCSDITNDRVKFACDIIKNSKKYGKILICYTKINNIKKTKNPGEVIILNKNLLYRTRIN